MVRVSRVRVCVHRRLRCTVVTAVAVAPARTCQRVLIVDDEAGHLDVTVAAAF